jgi:hypothetical protein
MPGEEHAHQVVDFALVPVGRAPQTAYAGHPRQLAGLVVVPARQHHLEHQAGLLRQAEQVVDDLHVRLPVELGRFLGIGLVIVHARNAVEKIEPQIGLVAQVFAQRDQARGRNFDPGIDRLKVRAGDLVAELLLQPVEKSLSAHR